MAVLPETAVKLLRQRSRLDRDQRMRHGEQVRARLIRALRDALPPAAEAYLVGSLAWGGFGPHSDVDLVVRGVEQKCALHLERIAAEIAAAELDLLDFDELPASFRERAVSEGVRIHDA